MAALMVNLKSYKFRWKSKQLDIPHLNANKTDHLEISEIRTKWF